MEDAAYPPLTHSGHPPYYGSSYHSGPQTFSTRSHPLGPASRVQQQSRNNIVVLQYIVRPVDDHYLTFGIWLTFLFFFCGSWFALLCTIPAIISSILARNADVRGLSEAARTHGYIACGLNICGFLTGVLFFVGVVITIVVFATES